MSPARVSGGALCGCGKPATSHPWFCSCGAVGGVDWTCDAPACCVQAWGRSCDACVETWCRICGRAEALQYSWKCDCGYKAYRTWLCGKDYARARAKQKSMICPGCGVTGTTRPRLVSEQGRADYEAAVSAILTDSAVRQGAHGEITPVPAREPAVQAEAQGRKCRRLTGCRNDAVKVVRYTPCRCSLNGQTVDYCASCAADVSRGVTCKCGTMVDVLSARSFYEEARERWMNGEGIAAKDAMVDAVTLTEPPDWDTFGSIMKPEPAPPVPVPRRMLARAGSLPALPVLIVMFAIILGICLGAALF